MKNFEEFVKNFDFENFKENMLEIVTNNKKINKLRDPKIEMMMLAITDMMGNDSSTIVPFVRGFAILIIMNDYHKNRADQFEKLLEELSTVKLEDAES